MNSDTVSGATSLPLRETVGNAGKMGHRNEDREVVDVHKLSTVAREENFPGLSVSTSGEVTVR